MLPSLYLDSENSNHVPNMIMHDPWTRPRRWMYDLKPEDCSLTPPHLENAFNQVASYSVQALEECLQNMNPNDIEYRRVQVLLESKKIGELNKPLKQNKKKELNEKHFKHHL